MIAGFQPARGHRVFEGERNRGGGGVAIVGDLVDHDVGAHTQPLAGGLDDAGVGLVRNDELDVLQWDVGLL